jgi:hypothetical protein
LKRVRNLTKNLRKISKSSSGIDLEFCAVCIKRAAQFPAAGLLHPDDKSGGTAIIRHVSGEIASSQLRILSEKWKYRVVIAVRHAFPFH